MILYPQTYLVGAPMSVAGADIMDPTIKFNNYRFYGTILLCIIGSYRGGAFRGGGPRGLRPPGGSRRGLPRS